MDEQRVRAVAHLYEIRDTARFLWATPEEYERATKPYRDLFERWQANPNGSILAFYTKVGNDLQGMDAPSQSIGVAQIALTAALVDILDKPDPEAVKRRAAEVAELLGVPRG